MSSVNTLAPTLPRAFMGNVQKRGDAPFLYQKVAGRWQAVSWQEVEEKVRFISLGLLHVLEVQAGEPVGAISETIPEMIYCCLAIATTGGIFAPIYHTNSPKECAHVINDTGAKIVFAEDHLQLAKLKKAFKDCPNLERLIVFKPEKTDDDPRVMSLEELMQKGKKAFAAKGDQAFQERIRAVKPEDVSAIIYTSGTTGLPKGVMFTNAGIIRAVSEFSKLFPMSGKSLGISFLPMAHALELMDGHWRHIIYGFPQIYAQSLQTLYQDIQEMKPTFFFQTPRFYEKVFNAVMADIQACRPWKRALINGCLIIGRRYRRLKQQRGSSPIFMGFLNAMAHLFFFRRVHAHVGGRAQWGGSGGSPTPPKVFDFFVACGFPIYQGYGLTESQGVISQNRPGATKVGTIGKPMDGLEVTIASDGEILVKGWARCAGYWNKPEATQELFAEGWLHTGDLGFLDEDGYLQITGRKKEIIITATGKNISPLMVQNTLKSSPYLNEVVVFGEGKRYLSALVTLELENIGEYARQNNINVKDPAALSHHPQIQKLIESEISEKNTELARIEQVKRFTILDDQLQQQRGELTPTMKVKRKVVEKRYQDAITAMYPD